MTRFRQARLTLTFLVLVFYVGVYFNPAQIRITDLTQ
jgi:hypothetical protein